MQTVEMFWWISTTQLWKLLLRAVCWLLLSEAARSSDVSLHDSDTEWNSWLGSQNSELTSCSTEPPPLQLSDSAESSVCLRTWIRYCDPADGLCRSRNVHHKAGRKKRLAVAECVCGGFNRSHRHVCSHDCCSHTWLSYWMDYAHVHTHMIEEVYWGNSHTEVFMPERDYVLWKGNLPWQSHIAVRFTEYNNSTESLSVALIQKCISNSHHCDTSPMS